MTQKYPFLLPFHLFLFLDFLFPWLWCSFFALLCAETHFPLHLYFPSPVNCFLMLLLPLVEKGTTCLLETLTFVLKEQPLETSSERKTQVESGLWRWCKGTVFFGGFLFLFPPTSHSKTKLKVVMLLSSFQSEGNRGLLGWLLGWLPGWHKKAASGTASLVVLRPLGHPIPLNVGWP